MPAVKGTIVLRSRPGDAAAFPYWSARGIDAARLSFREALAATQQLHQEQRAAFRAEDSQLKFLQNSVTWHDLYSPEVIVDHLGQATTKVRALQTFCAVERFRRREQRMPKSLEELVPGYLAAIPADPYTDQPLAMATPTEDGYTIYGKYDSVFSFVRLVDVYGPGMPGPGMSGPPPGTPPLPLPSAGSADVPPNE